MPEVFPDGELERCARGHDRDLQWMIKDGGHHQGCLRGFRQRDPGPFAAQFLADFLLLAKAQRQKVCSVR